MITIKEKAKAITVKTVEFITDTVFAFTELQLLVAIKTEQIKQIAIQNATGNVLCLKTQTAISVAEKKGRIAQTMLSHFLSKSSFDLKNRIAETIKIIARITQGKVNLYSETEYSKQ